LDKVELSKLFLRALSGWCLSVKVRGTIVSKEVYKQEVDSRGSRASDIDKKEQTEYFFQFGGKIHLQRRRGRTKRNSLEAKIVKKSVSRLLFRV